MKFWYRLKLARRLRKMEKALNLRLRDDQRALVLDPNPPNELHEWPRRSGKTTCACLHLLLHAPVTARYTQGEALRLMKDPDTLLGPQVMRWNYSHLYETACRLHSAGIWTCVLLPPMPGVMDGYVGHGRFDGKRKER